MPRTRSTKGATAAASKDKTTTTPDTPASTSLYTLPSAPPNPPKLFILPESATPKARIITLQNPRYSRPARYLVCPTTGFYEFTKITTPSPSSQPRSWLLTPSSSSSSLSASSTTIQSPDLFLATPYDPLFLILPALATPCKRMFLSPDDHLDALPNPDRHLSNILTCESTRKLVERRMAVICDTVEAGDEVMYRLNEAKLLSEIISKAKKMAKDLPKSMEDKFVKKALEAPVMSIKSSQAPLPALAPPSLPTDESSADLDTQSAAAASSSSSSSATTPSTEMSESQLAATSTAATSVASRDDLEIISSSLVPSPEVLSLQRLRVSFSFILSSYLPPSLSAALKTQLPSQIDFKELDAYLDTLQKLRQEAAASRANDFSGKRTRDEEEDERLEKKRKLAEEEKLKKANVSRGVKKLAKVNVTGMKKMSDFFKKK
ncbi:putative ribonuclease [Cladorrhinum samala]|uniref:Ribonuclease H2 subunit B n=1 Tax=Cladorrhinum samala TaxID=585594 RepID=A0AAV9HUH0_9PEZI|nr:putative ribonuclease [Cladorrhinum samala]